MSEKTDYADATRAELLELIEQLQEDNASIRDALKLRDEEQPEAFARSRTFVLGELSRVIAHDFKNLVMTMQGNAEMALRSPEDGARVQHSLNAILLACRDSRDLSNRVLNYARDRRAQYAPVNLCRVIEEAVQIIEPLCADGIGVKTELPEGAVAVHGSQIELHQLVMNLSLNAIEAMKASGGELSICLSSPDEGSAQVTLIIKDTGGGIDPDYMARMFDPAFTTRRYGAGHGLGLAIVKQVVDSHGGEISVASEPGEGTRFTVLLPVAEEAPVEPMALSATPNVFSRRSGRKRTVLYVDDEESMRNLGMDMLQSLGFRVSVAVNGREALEIVRRNPEYFDVIVSDSKMPELGGMDLARMLSEIRPDLPFILVTAFNNPVSEREQKKLGIAEIMRKPFMLDELNRALERALTAEK